MNNILREASTIEPEVTNILTEGTIFCLKEPTFPQKWKTFCAK